MNEPAFAKAMAGKRVKKKPLLWSGSYSKCELGSSTIWPNKALMVNPINRLNRINRTSLG
jgi:hypothetical protein